MPTMHTPSPAELEKFQRAVQEFNAAESRRLFGEIADVEAVQTATAGVERERTVEPGVPLSDDGERDGGWSAWLRDNLTDPALFAVAASVLVWGGLGVMAFRQWGSTEGDLRAQLATTQAAEAEARLELAAARTREQAAVQAKDQEAKRGREQAASLNSQLIAAQAELRTWELCAGTSSPAGLLQIEIPAAGENAAFKVCVAPSVEIAKALETGTSPTEAQVKAVVERMLHGLRIPADGKVEVKLSSPADLAPMPDGSKPPLLVYRWNLDRQNPVDPNSPDGGKVLVIPNEDQFGSRIKDR